MAASVSAIGQASMRRKSSTASSTLAAFNEWVDGLTALSSKTVVQIAMGRQLATTIDAETSGRDMASNTKRLMEIMDSISAECERSVESGKQARVSNGQGVQAFDPTSIT